MGAVFHSHTVLGSEDIMVNTRDMLSVCMELKFQWKAEETFTI